MLEKQFQGMDQNIIISPFSKKVKEMIQTISLSVGIILSSNVYATNGEGEIENTTINNVFVYNHAQSVYNELTYLSIEENEGLVSAIIKKMKDDGKYHPMIEQDLLNLETSFVRFYENIILEKGTDFGYHLDTSMIELLKVTIQAPIKIFLRLRYEHFPYDIFDGGDYSQYLLRITFKKVGNTYNIQRIYIYAPINESPSSDARDNFFHKMT